MPRCDVQAASSLDAARTAAGPKRGVFREAGAQCRRSRCQPGGRGGGPGAGRPERETAQRTAGPGESRHLNTRQELSLFRSLHDHLCLLWCRGWSRRRTCWLRLCSSSHCGQRCCLLTFPSEWQRRSFLLENQSRCLKTTTTAHRELVVYSAMIAAKSSFSLYFTKRIQHDCFVAFRLHTEAPGGPVRCRAAQTQTAASFQPGGFWKFDRSHQEHSGRGELRYCCVLDCYASTLSVTKWKRHNLSNFQHLWTLMVEESDLLEQLKVHMNHSWLWIPNHDVRKKHF